MPNTSLEAPFLDTDPPHWAARGLGYFIIALFLLTAIGTAVIRVPETVSGRFVLIPVRGTDPIRAIREGVVVEVRAREGEPVSDGSLLFLLQSSPMGDRSAQRRSLEAQMAADSTRLAIAVSQLETRRRADQGEARRLETKIDFMKRIIASKMKRYTLARELADSAASGMRRGSIGRLEASRLEFEASTLQEEIQTSQDELDDTEASFKRLRQDGQARELEYQETKRGLEESLETARIRIAALGRDLVNISDAGMAVTAPCAGTVLRLHVNAPGAVVKEGEVLSEIACDGARLQGELELPQAGVPMVRAGQGVKLRFDAFPYQRYGVRFGTVRWLGPSGSTERDSGAFRALVDLQDSIIRVQGRAEPLRPGMGGLADIVVGRRSLVSFALEPVRALKESFAEPPPSSPVSTPK